MADAEKVVVTLGDAPLITPAVIERFAGEEPRTRAVYNGRTAAAPFSYTRVDTTH